MCTQGLQLLLSFSDKLSKSSDHASSLSLSLRQTIRLVRRFVQYPNGALFPIEDLHLRTTLISLSCQDLAETLRRTLLAPFLPVALRENVEKLVSALSTAAGQRADVLVLLFYF